ncbi:uncharacterized protein P884DRAFT_332675 [Thermothelomyces heterothallicus CBS 202.75]|uniref:uncharacterized protein n=1 Tax=Thermothelomyces heterothallicus CBS 202.75 TaxID=1149848 RepID=UPI00374283BF
MIAIAVEDDDLMFGGKPLCAWHEEHRRSLVSRIVDDSDNNDDEEEEEEEEERGRQRERRSRSEGGLHHDRHHHGHRRGEGAPNTRRGDQQSDSTCVLSPVLAGLAALASLVAAAPIAPGNDNPAPSLRPTPPRTRIFSQLLRRWGKHNGKGKGKGIADSSGGHGGSKMNIWEPGYVVFERPGPWRPTTTTTTTPASSSSTSSSSPADWDATVVLLTVSVTVFTATENGPELGATTTEPSATAAALVTDPGTNTSYSAELAATETSSLLSSLSPAPLLAHVLSSVASSATSSSLG